MKSLKVLIACEYSGTVRDAFAALGHNAISCDLLPTDKPGKHYTGDIFDIITAGWDMMIAHPPCTFITNSGVRWLASTGKKPGFIWSKEHKININPGRWANMIEGTRFFRELLHAPIERKGLENPIPHKYGLSFIGRKYDQLIQPYHFGHTERKATCLWLQGLDPLKHTANVYEEMKLLPKKETQKIFYASPGADRWKIRSTTFTGIAAAMAMQWGGQVTAKDVFMSVKKTA